jgi:hypothetical protein
MVENKPVLPASEELLLNHLVMMGVLRVKPPTKKQEG